MRYEEKTPYLLTILFVALGWTISQVSTDLTKSPIIEYKQCRKTKTNETKHIFTITNISSEKAFSNLIFNLRPEPTSGAKCLGETRMIVPPPTELKNPSQEEGACQPECVNGKYANYILPQLQPGAIVQLVMNTDKAADVNIYIWCNDPVRLVESSLQTLVVKNRFCVMIGLICIWAFLISLYLVLLHKKRRSNPKNEGGKQ